MSDIKPGYRICRQFRSAAGIGLEPVGAFIHAATPEAAVARCIQIYPWMSGLRLVAVPEQV